MPTWFRLGTFACLCVSIGFVLGYLYHSKHSDIHAHHAHALASGYTQYPLPAAHPQAETVQTQYTISYEQHNTEHNQSSALTEASKFEQQQSVDEQDIVFLLDDLIAYLNGDNDFNLYGKKIDAVRRALKQSDTNLAQFMDYFEKNDLSPRNANLLVSLLNGLPEEFSQPAVKLLAQRALDENSDAGTERFLNIIALTDVYDQEIIEGLANIAIYESSTSKSMRAMDQLMPYQLDDIAREQVLSKLQNLNNTVVDDIDAEQDNSTLYFNQLLRFTPAEQREQMALQTLESAEQANHKMLILDAIVQGAINNSAPLKQVIFNMARNPSHPLHESAQYTLTTRFELSNEEYKQLQAPD